MLNNLTNFFNLITGRKIKTSTTIVDTDLIALGVKDPNYEGGYQPAAISYKDFVDSLPEGIQSVTGLDTDNTDPLNPVVQISVDGTSITGTGTPSNPLTSVNVYNSDGTLDANRTVDLDSNTINFNDGKVGVNVTPGFPLQVRGKAVPSAGETVARFDVTDSSAYLSVINGTSANGVFAPMIQGRQIGTSIQSALITEGVIDVADDTGTAPVTLFKTRLAGLFQVVTRPVFRFSNWNLDIMTMLANGNVGIGTTTPTSRLEVQALNGNSGERVLGIRNHTNTGWAFEVRNNLDIIANGGTNNDNITSIGYLSGKLGNANTFYGRSAGQSISTGEDNTMVGYATGLSCSTGGQNVFVGTTAGSGNNGSSNVFVGALAGAYNTGSGNIIVGSGFAAAYGTGAQNCFFGQQSGLSLSSGDGNCGVGRLSLGFVGTGSYNISMGQDSGAYKGVGFDSNANPSNSIFLGAYSRANDSNQTNQIVIGHNATGEGSNTARIGNSSVTELHVGGNGASLALKSPNGTTWRISVDNTGALVIV